MELLFSYGTLQQQSVQISTFGRKLKGYKDTLSGYIISEIEIFDEEVIMVSGKKFHPILVETSNPNDIVRGVAFELSSEEIICADKYEVDSYIRKKVTLDSDRNAWIYVGSD